MLSTSAIDLRTSLIKCKPWSEMQNSGAVHVRSHSDKISAV